MNASKKKKLLIIEAHSDDSAISCSGFLDKYRDEYEYHFVLACASDLNMHHIGLVTRDTRLAEYQLYVDYFHGIWHTEEGLPFDKESRLDTIAKRDIVSAMENVILGVKPDVLFCQGPSFHHDHTLTYEATIAATRPTARFLPSKIYIMENPTYVHSTGPSTDFKPDMYCTLSLEDMLRKRECIKRYYPSQAREQKNYLSIEGIESWARYRGIECRSSYAEAFKTFINIV